MSTLQNNLHNKCWNNCSICMTVVHSMRYDNSKLCHHSKSTEYHRHIDPITTVQPYLTVSSSSSTQAAASLCSPVVSYLDGTSSSLSSSVLSFLSRAGLKDT